jgi:K+-sensing histidine kinase KdpD
MNAEFENIRLMHGAEVTTKFRSTKIDAVIQSILYLYDQDFQNRKIKTFNEESSEYLNLDWGFFVCALIPIFENILKYTKDNTQLKIEYIKEKDKFVIRYKMKSLIFSSDEELLMLSKNYSGELARKIGKSGQGLGMYHAKKLLAINKATLKLYYSPDAETDGNFRDNILDISFERN